MKLPDSIFSRDNSPSLRERLRREGVPDSMADMALRRGLEAYLATRPELPLWTGVELVLAQAEKSHESVPLSSPGASRLCEKIASPGIQHRCSQKSREALSGATTAPENRPVGQTR